MVYMLSLEKPARGGEFFDREEELKHILEYITRGEHTVVIGLRKVGKTSILFRLIDVLADNYIVFYYYVPETSNMDILFSDIKSNFLTILADSAEPHEVPETIIERYPQISREVLRFVRLESKAHNFKTMLELMDSITKKLDKRFVFILDEFQNIVNIERSLMDYIRQAIWSTHNTVFVFCGSAIRMIEDILTGDSSIQGLRRIKIRPFDFEKAREFMIRLSRKTLGETHIAFLYYITGGMPFHIKAIIKSLNVMPIEKVSWRAIAKVLEEELFQDTGILYNYYNAQEIKLRSKSPLYPEILYQISQGNTRLSQIAAALNREPQDLNHYVRRLREMDIIDENNIINDGLFAIWFKTTWYLTNKMPIIRVRDRYRAFQKRINEIIQTYKTYMGYTVELIIRELVGRFDNRRLSTGEILPRFDVVISNARINDVEIDLLCIRGKNTWVIEIKSGPLTESDIIEFYEKTQKIPHNITKRIIIALHTISSEALEKANGLGIEIWDRQRVRTLLRIFGIPITKPFF